MSRVCTLLCMQPHSTRGLVLNTGWAGRKASRCWRGMGVTMCSGLWTAMDSRYVCLPACLLPPLPAAHAIHSRQVLKLTYIRARQAHYPVTDRSSNTVPPLVAQYHPKRRRSSVAAQVFRRKTEETPEMDTMELDTTVLPVDAMGRFWGRFLFHVFHDYNRLMYRWCWCSRVCAARGDPAVEVPDPC